MNASVDWLKAFVPIDASPIRLRDLLTAHTAPVDEVVSLRTDLAPILVARVVEAGRHPDSDHLWLTKVDAGGELLEVVCGAPNVTVGKLYPFAPVGTVMPNGTKLDRRKIRGIVSNGMLCSARELGLGEDHEGILELAVDAVPGTKFLAAMPVGDSRLVIDVGANRSDLQSHLGIARELSAITGTPWHLPEIPGLSPTIPSAVSGQGSATTGGVTIRVDADTKTRRYMAVLVKGVRVGPSPEWLVRRLESVGVRSINNVVDSTNYVLHELGQPVHAFDLRRLTGGRIVVRMAAAGERLVTLDGTTRPLPQNAVVIADGERAQAVAGVMGGKDSEVTDSTTDLFIEVASFDPQRTRSARRALGLPTDASYRFERGVDPAIGPIALDRVARLIITLAGGSVADAPADVVSVLPKASEITLRMKRVTQILGKEIPADEARRYLTGAGFEVPKSSATEMRVTVPTWRDDVRAEVDLVEEIARFHGYDAFPNEIRAFRPTTTFDDPMWGTAERLRTLLVGLGIHESRPLPFVKGALETHVRVANPLSEEEAYLRTSLLETLARSAEFNLSHRVGDVRLFEIGSVFSRSGRPMPVERVHLGVLLMGNRRPPHFSDPQPGSVDEWDIKGVAESAARVAFPGQVVALVAAEDHLWDVTVGARVVGRVLRLPLDAPVWAAPAFALELTLADVVTDAPAPKGQHNYIEGSRPPAPSVTKFRALPSNPSAEFDLALIVPTSLTAADVELVIRDSAGELLESLILFDEYTGQGIAPGTRSLAWQLTFRHPDRTLRDKEIEARRSKILSALEQRLHVRQRST